MKLNEMNLGADGRAMMVRNQKWGWALKSELEFSLHGAPNNQVTVLAGGKADLVKGSQIANLAEQTGKDCLHLGLRDDRSKSPARSRLPGRATLRSSI